MIVDIILSNARVYNIEKVDIRQGEKFSLLTDAAADSKHDWFANNDAALSITGNENGSVVDITADEVGPVTLLVLDPNLATIKRITINVLEAIVPPAASLGITAGEPENK